MSGLKIAVSGKGGVGKTTLTVLLAREARRKGQKVLVVDADPDANVAATMGLEKEPPPLSQLSELIGARTGREGLVKLNPRVEDIPERFSAMKDGIRLVTLGAVRSGGGGCACPESSFLRQLLLHLLLERDELVLVDMEAGGEHLGRGTAQGVNALLLVVDPDLRSLHTAGRIVRLAEDLNLSQVWAVANKVGSAADARRIEGAVPRGLRMLGTVGAWDELRLAGVHGLGAVPPELEREVGALLSALQGELGAARAGQAGSQEQQGEGAR